MPKNKTPKRRPRPARAGEPSQETPPQTDAFPVVGIGASAGGLEAVTQLLKALPPRTGLALVLVQHLDPTHESALTVILARATSMPVSEARHNMRLAPNNVYVIPPNKLMRISEGRLKLSPREDTDAVLAVDNFFRTLAECEGNRAIGVVLSGNGSDGTQGCLAIKAAGGITFAQEEKTCRYPAMPGNAITAGCVDFVLPPDRIARELARLAGHPYIGPAHEAEEPERPALDRALDPILLLLRQRMHVDFTQYKHATLRRRIHRRMALHKLESLGKYKEYLRAHPTEAKELYNDILIHVTGFFRDANVFQFLKKKVFPRILKGKTADDPVRIWVPGCSTGEEAYSLGISVVEFLAEHKLHNPVQIFATDINDQALEKARAGLYPEAIQMDVSPERLRRFFAKAPGGYRINKSLREMCLFARQNVVVDPPFSKLDLISCRNVLIYLGAPLQRKVLPLFHYALLNDGFLVLGVSETVGGFADLFWLVDKKAKVYARKGTGVRPAVSFGTVRAAEPVAAAREPARPGIAPSLYDLQRQADRVLLTHFTPAGVLINRHMEVLQFRGHTGPFLEHPHGEANLNLLKMAREGLAGDLRATITRAMKQGIRVVLENARVRQNGNMLEVRVEVIPFAAPPAPEKFFLVLFQPAAAPRSERVPKPKPAKSRTSEPKASEQARLEEELAATRDSLQAIIEEQEATNEELRSANEEVMSSNEELQSTNEELETAKEELQSTNEELTTLNDELESRNSELQTVNNDLHNLLTSANIPIIILSLNLRIRRFTLMAERTFNLLPGDIGRPITDLNLPLNIPDLGTHLTEVLDNLATKELEVKSNSGQWWQVRIRPYKTTDNKIDGLVIAVHDIDALKSNVRLADQGRAFAESVLNMVRQPIVALDKNLVVQFLNSAFCQAFQLKAEQALHLRLFDVADGHWNIPALRALLEDVLPRENNVPGFELEHDFPGVGRQRLRLSARRLELSGPDKELTLLMVESMEQGEER
ncbi:MAG TPA: chemotaxis protein CheB [Candidatus Acidoferrum sp.]|nr:chemotaxis protein CheB [Candidatus Acidoferrum sp.]